MPNLTRILKNIDRLNLSTGWIILMVLALLGSLISYLSYKWIDMATSQTVDLHATSPAHQQNTANIKSISDRIDVDVVLAVDFSGSMEGDHGSDPDNLRLRAAEIMASTLAADIFPRNTSMGFVEFGSTALPSSELISVEKEEDRQILIQKIYERSDKAENEDWTKLTNISGALDESTKLLDNMKASREKKGVNVKNVPAIILLTDGVPTIGKVNVNGSPVDGTSMIGVKKQLDQLTSQGILIFVVVLRNPEKEKLTDGANKELNEEFAKWRAFWFETTNEKPDQIKYFEAQSDEQLEGMYNVIRSRLVKEGTHPTDRVEYNPLDSNSSIDIPSDILQAQLVVSKPSGVQSIDLVAPDGWKFQDTALADPRNKLLQGNSFYRFSLYKPIPGKWKLVTDAKKPLYYLLISESIYTAQPYAVVGKPYVLPDRTSELSFVIVDDQNKIVDGMFGINASILSNVKKDDGSYVEEVSPIATLKQINRDGISQYILTVTPEMIKGKTEFEVQIDGKSESGTPINVSMITVPVINSPTELTINLLSPIHCDNEKLIFWPPEIRCGNTIAIDANIPEGDLLETGSLYGNIYSPIGRDKIEMDSLSGTMLQANVGPLPSMGAYEFAAVVGGKIKNKGGDYEWQQQGIKDVVVIPPVWVEIMKHRLWYLCFLLLLVALWKPVIVTILLPIFALLKIAPSGYYNNSDDGGSSRIYDLAMQRRKLFTLTVGKNKKYADIPLYSEDVEPAEIEDYPHNFIGRMLRSLKIWLKNQPRARLVAVPWSGIWCEKPSGEIVRAPRGHSYMTVSFDGVQMQVSQDDWHQD